jgi:hypothetical protein
LLASPCVGQVFRTGFSRSTRPSPFFSSDCLDTTRGPLGTLKWLIESNNTATTGGDEITNSPNIDPRNLIGRSPLLQCCLFIAVALATAAPRFTGGPSVRVTPDVSVEFLWITDVAWLGKVEVFDNPYGTGIPIVIKQSVDALGEAVAATHQDIIVPVGPALAAHTGYFFRVTATDPTGTFPDLVTPTPLPPFFTSAHTAKESAASLVSLPVYTAREAAQHVGETATITDKVGDVHLSGKGNIFLNMGGTYPDPAFTAFIPARSAAQFPQPQQYKRRTVAVSGKITLQRGKPEIIVTSPAQIHAQ